MRVSLARRVAAEAIGTALLLATVVGSGIMGERLSGGSVGLALLANALATGAGLVAFILALGPISGAHFNPVVTAVEAARGALPLREAPAYFVVQIVGAFAGVLVAHAMFGEPIFQVSRHVRAGGGQLIGEFVATFGLLAVIAGCGRARPSAVHGSFDGGASLTGLGARQEVHGMRFPVAPIGQRTATAGDPCAAPLPMCDTPWRWVSCPTARVAHAWARVSCPT